MRVRKEDIENALEYVFQKKKKEIDYTTLHITQTEEFLVFKIGTITAGIKGFINLQKEGLIPIEVTTVVFNGETLNEEKKLDIFRQINLIKNELEN